jgi:hypothetical protein
MFSNNFDVFVGSNLSEQLFKKNQMQNQDNTPVNNSLTQCFSTFLWSRNPYLPKKIWRNPIVDKSHLAYNL